MNKISMHQLGTWVRLSNLIRILVLVESYPPSPPPFLCEASLIWYIYNNRAVVDVREVCAPVLRPASLKVPAQPFNFSILTKIYCFGASYFDHV